MKAIRITLDEDLVAAVDRVARRLKTTRSAFARDALRKALTRYRVQEIEEHRCGYQSHPAKKREFDVWQREQCWPDE